MAEVFTGEIKSTDGTLTLEVTPSEQLGVTREPAPTPQLELNVTPAAEQWTKSTPSLVLDGASAAAAAKTPAPTPQLVVETAPPTYTPSSANIAAAAAAPVAAAAPAASVYAAPAVSTTVAYPGTPAPAPASAAAVAQPAPAAQQWPAQYATPVDGTYAQYASAVNNQTRAAVPSAEYAQTFNAATPGLATYPSAPVEQLYLYPEAIYPMTQRDRNFRQIAFIFNVLSCVCAGIFIIPLAWMIPMTVISWGIYKGTRKCTTTFAIVNLIFTNLVSGILYLCGQHE